MSKSGSAQIPEPAGDSRRVAVRTFEYKAIVKKPVHLRLNRFLEQQRQLYNAGLQERIDAYQKTRDTNPMSIGKFDQFKSLTELRRDLPEFAQFHVGCQRTALMRLDEAYKRFFKAGGFPRFKKYGSVNSFDAHDIGVKHTNRRGSIVVKGVGRFKWKFDDRYTSDQVKLVRVARQPRGVYVQLVCEVDLDDCGSDNVVGIDVGVKDRAVLSNGACIEKARRKVRYLKRMQRLVSRSRKGSGSRKRKVQRLRKEHHRIRIRERNALHRETSCIVKNHGKHVVVEDLRIGNLTSSAKGDVESPGRRVRQKSGLNRSILEQCWGEFVTQLEYKCEAAGGSVTRVDPMNTTQNCSNCGSKPENILKLQERTYRCGSCGYLIDRDYNAARNILLKGLVVLDAAGGMPRRGQKWNFNGDAGPHPRKKSPTFWLGFAALPNNHGNSAAGIGQKLGESTSGIDGGFHSGAAGIGQKLGESTFPLLPQSRCDAAGIGKGL